MRRRSARLVPAAALGAILALAAFLRFVALPFGRGVGEARPDENAVLAALAMMHATGFPLLVLYGGGYLYPLAAFVALSEASGWPAVFGAGIQPGLSTAQLAARAWSALLSTATVWLVYLIGRRVGSRRAALLAAALLASCTLAIREAHFAKADGAAAFVAALVLLAVANPDGRSVRRTLLIGAAGGLALSTKLSVGLLPVVLLALADPRTSGRTLDWRAISLGGTVLTLVTVALNPFWITHPALTWVLARAGAVALTTVTWLPGGDTVPGPLRYHVGVSPRFGCGAAMTVLALPALVWALRRPGAPRLIAVAVLGQWLVLLSTPMVLARFFLPSIVPLVLLVACLVDYLTAHLPLPPKWRGPALVIAGCLVAAEPLYNGITLVRLLRRTDTRALAAEWIAAHVPQDAQIVSYGAPRDAVVDWDYGRPLVGARPVLRELAPDYLPTAADRFIVWHHYPLPYSSEPLPSTSLSLRSVATFDPGDGVWGDPVLEPVDAFYLPLARFGGTQRPGPRIEIFALPPP